MEKRGLLESVLRLSAAYGVTRGGVCRLEDLSHFIECRGRSSLPAHGSVVVLLLPFYTGEHPRRNVAAYAVPDDYHRIAGAILERIIAGLRREYPGSALLPFVDSSPIPEVEAAELAGLGFRGRNRQLITPEYGSLTFICEIVTDLAEPPTTGPGGSCGECWRCVDACPTGALWQDTLDPQRCRSQLTQKKGELTPWEARQIERGGLAWGCDLCTMACPRNARREVTTVPELTVNLLPRITLEDLDAQMTQKSYIWRGKAVLRRNLDLIGTAQSREEQLISERNGDRFGDIKAGAIHGI